MTSVKANWTQRLLSEFITVSVRALFVCVLCLLAADGLEGHSRLRKLRPSTHVSCRAADCSIPTSGSRVHYHLLSTDICWWESRIREQGRKQDGNRRDGSETGENKKNILQQRTGTDIKKESDNHILIVHLSCRGGKSHQRKSNVIIQRLEAALTHLAQWSLDVISHFLWHSSPLHGEMFIWGKHMQNVHRTCREAPWRKLL